MDIWLEWLLWGLVSMVAMTTIGYPLFLASCWLHVRRPRQMDAAERPVSLIITAFNEEAVIAAKVENALQLDYPPDRLEIIVASDGSTDRTDEIAQSFADRGVTLLHFPRTGKTGGQNEVARLAKGEILVFSDANAFYQPDAIRKLVRNFAAPDVACVSASSSHRVQDHGAGACEKSYCRTTPGSSPRRCTSTRTTTTTCTACIPCSRRGTRMRRPGN
jgi:cellulose synthase/poly-beta-1,6-N-acetylglucosamine synthase-like glycosyltransferase